MSFEYRQDGVSSNPETRNDFMDQAVKGTPFDFAGGSRPLISHVEDWTHEELEKEFKSSGIAHKIICKPAQDATRNGFTISIPSDPKLQELYQKALDDLNINNKLEQELEYRNLYGDGYLSIGIEEESSIGGTDRTSDNEQLYNPINTENIARVAFLHPFGSNNVQEVQLGTNPMEPNYLREDKLVINQPQKAPEIDKTGNVIPTGTEQEKIVIDSSRYCHTSLDKLEQDAFGTSLLNRCKDAIQTMDSALFACIKLVREYNLKVYKSRTLTSQPDPKVREQLHTMLDYGVRTASIMAIAPDEDVENVSSNVNGIQALYDFAWQNLASACGIPKSVLTGEQSGTLAGASQDVINYYDMVKSIQENDLKPQIMYITRLLMLSSDVCGGVLDPDSLQWDIKFTPLWSTDDKTRSEAMYNITRSASLLVSGGMATPDEAVEFIKALSNNNNLNVIKPDDEKSNKTDSMTFTKKELAEYEKDLADIKKRMDSKSKKTVDEK